MAKTIPQLTEITTLDSNTLIPVDSSIQTYKVTLPNLAKGVLEQAPTNLFTSIWNSAKTYASGDVVFYVGGFYVSLAGSNLNKVPSASPLLWKKVSQSGLNPQASQTLGARAVTGWTASGTILYLNGPAYSPKLKRWVAGSYSGEIYYSDDGGATWSAGTKPAAAVVTNWADSAWAPELGKFVMVGWRGAGGSASTYQICYSTDGAVWTAATNPATGRGLYAVEWLAESGKFVAVGGSEAGLSVVDNAVVTSSDGVTWAQITAPEGTWFGLAYSPKLGRLLACSYTSSGGPAYDRFMKSDDAGASWSLVTITTDRVCRQALWVEDLELFLVTTSNDVVLYSQDGLTFSAAAISGTTGALWFGIAWSPELGVAVAVSTNTRDIIYSFDGITWTRVTNALAATDNWSRIMWSAAYGHFAALSAGVVGSNCVAISRHVKHFIAV